MATTKTNTAPIAPGACIGILGGGQLGRMTAIAAAEMGYRCLILEPQEGCPASHVADHIAGAYEDEAVLARFAEACDVVTLEFENVPVDALKFLEERVPVRPGSHALKIAQDRILEKQFLNDAGIGTAPWAEITDEQSLKDAIDRIGIPSVLKTARFGYDGKGQVMLKPGSDPSKAWEDLGRVRCILEGFVDFDCEVSVITARSANGTVKAFPVVMNEHRDHILYKTHAPADLPTSTAKAAEDIADKAIEALDLTGLLAVEMFACRDGSVLVNEVAPRPHNSGHWSIDACMTSQFQQLVRAVCGLPLGSTEILRPAEMTNLLGNEIDDWAAFLAEPNAQLHLYGKAEAKPGRKMGHVTRLK